MQLCVCAFVLYLLCKLLFFSSKIQVKTKNENCMSQYVTTVLFSWDLGLKNPTPYYYTVKPSLHWLGFKTANQQKKIPSITGLAWVFKLWWWGRKPFHVMHFHLASGLHVIYDLPQFSSCYVINDLPHVWSCCRQFWRFFLLSCPDDTVPRLCMEEWKLERLAERIRTIPATQKQRKFIRKAFIVSSVSTLCVRKNWI